MLTFRIILGIGIIVCSCLIFQKEYHKHDYVEKAMANLQASSSALIRENDGLRDVAELLGVRPRPENHAQEYYNQATAQLSQYQQEKHQTVLIFTIIGSVIVLTSCILLTAKRN